MKQFTMPELIYLYSRRVLICTLAVAGNLVRANGNASFKPDHFSHVIIDECACTHETLTMVPIAGKPYFFKLFHSQQKISLFMFKVYAQFPMLSKVALFWRVMQSNWTQ